MSLLLTPFVDDYDNRRPREHNTPAIRAECLRLALSPEGIPAPLRRTLWKALLQIPSDAPKPTGLASPQDETLSLDVELMLSNLGAEQNDAQADIEAVLAFFCKKTGTAYTPSLCELAMPIVLVYGGKDIGSIFHVLYRAASSLVVRLNPGVCDLHRSLLQYHDPTLSLHLDQRNRYSTLPLAAWHATCFASILGKDNVLPVWDYLLSAGTDDARRVLLVGIAILTLSRAFLMASGGDPTDAELCVLRRAATGHDIVATATALEANTPWCAHDDLRVAFSGEISISERVRKYIVLPITAEEIMRAFRSPPPTSPPPIKYIVLDCRSEKSFHYARLPTAVHIGTKVGYDADLMKAITERFVSAKGSHFCILGTGRSLSDENNLLNVLALQFV